MNFSINVNTWFASSFTLLLLKRALFILEISMCTIPMEKYQNLFECYRVSSSYIFLYFPIFLATSYFLLYFREIPIFSYILEVLL